MSNKFEEHLQKDVSKYPLRDIIDNLTDDELTEEIESYLKSRLIDFKEFWNSNNDIRSEEIEDRDIEDYISFTDHVDCGEL